MAERTGSRIAQATGGAGEWGSRALATVESGTLITAAGTRLKTSIGSICIHGDSPRAVEMARRLRTRLEAAGVQIAAFAPAGARSECHLPDQE